MPFRLVVDQQQIQAARQRRSGHCCRCDAFFGNAAPCAQALEHPGSEGGADAIGALQVALDEAASHSQAERKEGQQDTRSLQQPYQPAFTKERFASSGAERNAFTDHHYKRTHGTNSPHFN